MILEDLELQNLTFSSNQLEKRGKKGVSDPNLDDDEDEALIYDDDDFMYSNPQQGNASTNFKPVSADKKLRASDDMLRKLCYYCERVNCTFICSGPCRRGFHSNCKKEFENSNNWINQNGPERPDIPLEEDGKSEEFLRRLINKNASFICGDCKQNQVVCNICKKKGSYHGNAKSKKKKKQQNSTQLLEDEVEDLLIDEEEEEEELLDSVNASNLNDDNKAASVVAKKKEKESVNKSQIEIEANGKEEAACKEE